MTGLSFEYIRRATIEAAKQIQPHEEERNYTRQNQIWQAEDINWYHARCRAQRQDEEPVITADWNGPIMGKALQLFEATGAHVDWSDEVTSCSECGGAIDTSPHSYSHSPEYVVLNECEPICTFCLIHGDVANIDEEGTPNYSPLLGEYLRELEDDPHRAVTEHVTGGMLEDHGYELYKPPGRADTPWYEAGWYEGQNDDPSAILATFGPEEHVLFRVSSHGQFDTRFEVYVRREEETD